jgi:sec-independent protein translocase protein TatA
MGGLSLWHWGIVILVVALLFGGGRIAAIMGDVGKGIRNFRTGISDERGDD